MSHIIPIDKVNQFLPQDKLGLDTSVPQGQQYPVDHDVIKDLEETARDIVFGNLAHLYNVSEWSNGPTSMPMIIRNVLGMLVAGWTYDRQFSEESTRPGGYGQRRIREAYGIMNSIIEGDIILDADTVDHPRGSALVYETEPSFTMGEQF